VKVTGVAVRAENSEEFHFASAAHSTLQDELAKTLAERQGAATFDEVCKANTGIFMQPAKWSEQRERFEQLSAQTNDIADKLESVGIQARYKDGGLTRISLVTKEVEYIEALRNICFLPTMAQKNRRDQLNDLGYYLENIDGQHWRYAVITFGERIPAYGDLAGAITRANKMMARWRERILKKLGVTVGFTGLEFPRDADGTYHLHANILLKTPFFLDGGEEFRELTHAHFGTWWKDNGEIKNLHELVKYPFKPNSLDGADADELAWLFHSTFKRRITRIMGPIAEFRKQRKEDGLRVFKFKQQYRLREVGSISLRDNAMHEPIEGLEDELDSGGGGGENILIAKIAPNFADGCWAQPSVLVMNYNPEANWITNAKSHKRLETLWGWMTDALSDWEAAGAPDPKVAQQFAQAAREGVSGGGKLRALWDSEAARAKAEGRGAKYIFNNGTISSHEKDMLVIDKQDRFTDPPPKESDETCKVIKFPAKNIETEKTAPAVEEDVSLAESYADMLDAIFGCEDAHQETKGNENG
jgi:hypothetical protein